MLSFVLAVIVLPIAFASAATPTNQTQDCKFRNRALDVYQHPNATSSSDILPLAASINSTDVNITGENWQIIDSIGTGSDPSNVVNPEAQQLTRYLFLDTLYPINSSTGAPPLPLIGCSFMFLGLSSSDVQKTSIDSTCSNIFGSSCSQEIIQVALETTAAIRPQLHLSRLTDTCGSVTQAVNSYIKASSKSCNKNAPSIGITQALDFSAPFLDNCTDPPTHLPIALYEQDAPFQQGNFTLYDQWAKTPLPVLLTLFSNESDDGAIDRTDLRCTNPETVTAGSHHFRSAAVGSVVADRKIALGFALVTNAVVFLLL